MSVISIKFYRTTHNKVKLSCLALQAQNSFIPEAIDEPCEVFLTADGQDMKFFVYLWDIVRKNNQTALFLNNGLLTPEQASGIIRWIRCYNNRQYFPVAGEYCYIQPGHQAFIGWGCKQLHSVVRHGSFGLLKGIDWWKVGPFDGKVQHIDKEDIKLKLKAEAEVKGLDLCPLFSFEKAFSYADKLPGTINPEKDKGWIYDISQQPESYGVAFGVKPVTPSLFGISLYMQ